MGGLESVLARPRDLLADGEPDIAFLAPACAYGLARNHAFVDSNELISIVACLTALRFDGLDLPPDADVATWLARASGDLFEPELAAWLRARIRPPA